MKRVSPVRLRDVRVRRRGRCMCGISSYLVSLLIWALVSSGLWFLDFSLESGLWSTLVSGLIWSLIVSGLWSLVSRL